MYIVISYFIIHTCKQQIAGTINILKRVLKNQVELSQSPASSLVKQLFTCHKTHRLKCLLKMHDVLRFIKLKNLIIFVKYFESKKTLENSVFK